jgi:hypothetical protein
MGLKMNLFVEVHCQICGSTPVTEKIRDTDAVMYRCPMPGCSFIPEMRNCDLRRTLEDGGCARCGVRLLALTNELQACGCDASPALYRKGSEPSCSSGGFYTGPTGGIH